MADAAQATLMCLQWLLIDVDRMGDDWVEGHPKGTPVIMDWRQKFQTRRGWWRWNCKWYLFRKCNRIVSVGSTPVTRTNNLNIVLMFSQSVLFFFLSQFSIKSLNISLSSIRTCNRVTNCIWIDYRVPTPLYTSLTTQMVFICFVISNKTSCRGHYYQQQFYHLIMRLKATDDKQHIYLITIFTMK